MLPSTPTKKPTQPDFEHDEDSISTENPFQSQHDTSASADSISFPSPSADNLQHMIPPTISNIDPTTTILTNALTTPLIPRFHVLLSHARLLISQYGPYTLDRTIHIFSRGPDRANSQLPLPPATAEALALSFAAAQDASSAPAGDAQPDLTLFRYLWAITTELLEKLLSSDRLDPRAYAWGVLGLAAGYVCASAPETEKLRVVAWKDRARDALAVLRGSPREAVGREPMTRQKASREVHVCGRLLVETFREREWGCIRWWHGIAVVERWVGGLEEEELEYLVENSLDWEIR